MDRLCSPDKKEKKRDRGLRRGGRRRERRSQRPRSELRKRETGRESGRGEGEQGSGRGGFLLYPDRKTDWGAGEGSPPLIHALCKGLPDITKVSKTQGRSPDSPHQNSQRGLLQTGISLGEGKSCHPTNWPQPKALPPRPPSPTSSGNPCFRC